MILAFIISSSHLTWNICEPLSEFSPTTWVSTLFERHLDDEWLSISVYVSHTHHDSIRVWMVLTFIESLSISPGTCEYLSCWTDISNDEWLFISLLDIHTHHGSEKAWMFSHIHHIIVLYHVCYKLISGLCALPGSSVEPTTSSNYRCGFASISKFCKSVILSPLPVSVSTLCLWMFKICGRKRKPATRSPFLLVLSRVVCRLSFLRWPAPFPRLHGASRRDVARTSRSQPP